MFIEPTSSRQVLSPLVLRAYGCQLAAVDLITQLAVGRIGCGVFWPQRVHGQAIL